MEVALSHQQVLHAISSKDITYVFDDALSGR